MNKKEVVEILERVVKGSESQQDDWNKGYVMGLLDYKDLVRKIDEPEIPTIPKVIAEIIEQAGTNVERNKEYVIRSVIDQYYKYDFEDNVADWFDEKGNLLKFVRAVENGYTIKTEKQYSVKEPVTNQFLIRDSTQSSGVKWVDGFLTEPEYFTEKEIKAIEERYWSFAVEVKE